jgi:uncharacterized membrane protein YebE (DUF533 family)
MADELFRFLLSHIAAPVAVSKLAGGGKKHNEMICNLYILAVVVLKDVCMK